MIMISLFTNIWTTSDWLQFANVIYFFEWQLANVNAQLWSLHIFSSYHGIENLK